VVAPKIVTIPGCQHERGELKDGSFANESECNQGQIGSRSETLTNDKAKNNMKKGLHEVVVEQDMVLEAKAETKTKAGTSSHRPPNRTVRFLNSDHPVSLGSG
jgi:hypothetical protein